MATLDGNDLGKIQNESQTKDTSLFSQAIPTSDSDTSLLLDLFGVIRTISIDGIFTGTIANQVSNFITPIETIANGTQAGVTFVSSQTSFPNKKVFIQNFNWNFVKANPNKINYSLTLIEGA